MKKLSTILISFLAVFQLTAQQWVSTTAQNKNVVLEEFTGIHCGYCPDGHKKAADIKAANPDRVVLINIHAGGYAVPKAGEPDFRTTPGDAIDGAAGVTGYPSGSVNRKKSPWGQSRSTWAADASTVMNESSPVNVYVKGYVDLTTRELTTEVEIYYTANSAQNMNYLTVGLLQNQVLGPQSDYGNYNPTNWVGDQYIHNHILRQLMTANMGDVIDTTTSGHYIYKKFVTTLPADIKGVGLGLANLEVYAFVSETSANIYTGMMADVEYNTALTTDLSLANLTSLPADFCFTSINPKAEITNMQDNTITGFEVTVTIDGADYTETFSGSLAKNAKTTIDWGTINYVAKGEFSIDFKGFENVNGGSLMDINIMNNNSTISGIGFTDKALSTFSEDFESGILQPNTAFDLSNNLKLIIRKGTTTKYGALNTSAAALFYLHSSWNIAGKPADILFGEIDLSQVPNPFLTYYFAYQDGGYGGTTPHVRVEVSEDCGVTWKLVRDVELHETGTPPAAGSLYNPLSADYVWVGVPLSDYSGKEVLLKVSGVPGSNGNSMYVDEISLTTATDIVEDAGENGIFNLYPNPVENNTTVEFTVSDKTNVTMTVINSLSQQLIVKDLGNKTKGFYTENLDLSNLESGIYFVQLKSGDHISTLKFFKK